MSDFKITLISTYDLGRQPFGLASPAAWLREAGFETDCLDLAEEPIDPARVEQADLIAFHLPMHTATRLAGPYVRRIKDINPDAHLCFYGLYAALNESYLRKIGGQTILSGEFEAGLVALARQLTVRSGNGTSAQPAPLISLKKQQFLLPERQGLPPLDKYAQLHTGNGQPRLVGYTEASRGCKHHCRHCPIVPIYNGKFRVVQPEIVLADIRQQVAAGARHITFGDPDFFNGPGHAIPLVEAFHRKFPDLTYDVTIKIEHLLKHTELLATLSATGCLFITSAVESLDDRVLDHLNKGHTRADFYRAVQHCREAGLVLQPTFVAFHPWTTLAGYQDFLTQIAALDLIEAVPPIQLALRLLLPQGSLLLSNPEIQGLIGPYDEEALVYPWRHPDPEIDGLQSEIQDLVQNASPQGSSRAAIFSDIWELAWGAAGSEPAPFRTVLSSEPQTPIPFLSEPWYC
jgi:radical SAM superfamily enzyme YgiQ (UPF0313 family)